MLEIEKMESKKLKNIQKLIEWISSSTILSTIRTGKARAEEEMFTWKLTKNWAYLEILVPYLNNPSEEAIFGINKIKEELETFKLLNEEVMLRNTENLD